jgi:hypothetical protein
MTANLALTRYVYTSHGMTLNWPLWVTCHVALSCRSMMSSVSLPTHFRTNWMLCHGRCTNILHAAWTYTPVIGHAMAQAVSRRPPTMEAQVQSWVSPCGICGGQSGTGTGFSLSSSVFPCQFHSTGAPLLGKGQKIIIIIIIFIFIVGLHNKPHGCSASIASAVGPFTTTPLWFLHL